MHDDRDAACLRIVPTLKPIGAQLLEPLGAAQRGGRIDFMDRLQPFLGRRQAWGKVSRLVSGADDSRPQSRELRFETLVASIEMVDAANDRGSRGSEASEHQRRAGS